MQNTMYITKECLMSLPTEPWPQGGHSVSGPVSPQPAGHREL